jgi:hypothetical protein
MSDNPYLSDIAWHELREATVISESVSFWTIVHDSYQISRDLTQVRSFLEKNSYLRIIAHQVEQLLDE